MSQQLAARVHNPDEAESPDDDERGGIPTPSPANLEACFLKFERESLEALEMLQESREELVQSLIKKFQLLGE